MGFRRKGREYALQALYLSDITKQDINKSISHIIYGAKPEKAIADFAVLLAVNAASHQTEIDNLIQKYAQNWDLDRMAALDRNIIRLGAYEILHHPETPISVVIDEAVEIAKAFSTEESGKFVNGILDRIKKERGKDGVENK